MIDHLKRTKIIATCGPALTKSLVSLKMLDDNEYAAIKKVAYANIEAIIKSGVSVIRLNFSHGTHEEQQVRIKIVRDVAKAMNIPVSIMLDTNGPEIRIVETKKEGLKITKDSEVIINTMSKMIASDNQFAVSDASGKYNMVNDVNIGQKILVDDGKLTLVVTRVYKQHNQVICVAKNDHTVFTKKRLNLPNAQYSIPFLSEKDLKDIDFGLSQGIDYIAASFVNTVADIKQLRDYLKLKNASGVKIIAKIESNHALNNIDKIIKASDGIMVARGDLGLEIPYYQVPYWQRYMIKACRFFNKRSITATQMLDSLEKNIQPTRAEVTDVYFAVDRGNDATMLSGETASGLYPLNAVAVMQKIDKQSETFFDYQYNVNYYLKNSTANKSRFWHNVVLPLTKKTVPKRKLVNSAFKYDFIVYPTNNINRIYALSNARLAAAVIILTNNKRVYTGHGVDYGIFCYLIDKNPNQLTKAELIELAWKAINHYQAYGDLEKLKQCLAVYNETIINL